MGRYLALGAESALIQPPSLVVRPLAGAPGCGDFGTAQ